MLGGLVGGAMGAATGALRGGVAGAGAMGSYAKQMYPGARSFISEMRASHGARRGYMSAMDRALRKAKGRPLKRSNRYGKALGVAKGKMTVAGKTTGGQFYMGLAEHLAGPLGYIGAGASGLRRGVDTVARGSMAGMETAYRGAVAGVRGAAGAVRANVNPLNWSTSTLTKTTFGLGAVAGFAGYRHGKNRPWHPMTESGNLTMANPVQRRLNYSTVGLTQALHNKTRRTF